MQAVQLTGYNGPNSIEVVDVSIPRPAPDEVLIEVKASGLNFAELELTYGRYKTQQTPPFIMGFEAAGIVIEVGDGVSGIRPGDRVVGITSSGGYAEFATMKGAMAIPLPAEMDYAEAVTIPIQGLTAYLLISKIAHLQSEESVLIQAAAGGVGTYLVQLAKHLIGAKVIALVGSEEKASFVQFLGADFVVDTSDSSWVEKVRAATSGRGVDVVLESASGEIGDRCFELLAPAGRCVVFGSRNIYDTFRPEKMQQLIYNNQAVIGFNLPTFSPNLIAAAIPEFLQLVESRSIRGFAERRFPLAEVKRAFEALASRKTMGKVVLVPASDATQFTNSAREQAGVQ